MRKEHPQFHIAEPHALPRVHFQSLGLVVPKVSAGVRLKPREKARTPLLVRRLHTLRQGIGDDVLAIDPLAVFGGKCLERPDVVAVVVRKNPCGNRNAVRAAVAVGKVVVKRVRVGGIAAVDDDESAVLKRHNCREAAAVGRVFAGFGVVQRQKRQLVLPDLGVTRFGLCRGNGHAVARVALVNDLQRLRVLLPEVGDLAVRAHIGGGAVAGFGYAALRSGKVAVRLQKSFQLVAGSHRRVAVEEQIRSVAAVVDIGIVPLNARDVGQPVVLIEEYAALANLHAQSAVFCRCGKGAEEFRHRVCKRGIGTSDNHQNVVAQAVAVFPDADLPRCFCHGVNTAVRADDNQTVALLDLHRLDDGKPHLGSGVNHGLNPLCGVCDVGVLTSHIDNGVVAPAVLNKRCKMPARLRRSGCNRSRSTARRHFGFRAVRRPCAVRLSPARVAGGKQTKQAQRQGKRRAAQSGSAFGSFHAFSSPLETRERTQPSAPPCALVYSVSSP